MTTTFVDLMARVIRETFETQVGIWQVRGKGQGMLISFRIPVPREELGYRQKELFLYAPMGYVQVHTRETWDVISVADVEWDPIGEDDPVPLPGKEYTKGASPWKLMVSHDSGWRDAVRQFLAEWQENLLGFSGPNWYKVVSATEVGAQT